MTYEQAVAVLADRGYDVRLGGVEDLDEARLDALCGELARHGVDVQDYFADIDEYSRYVERAAYLSRHRGYYGATLPEKTFEHFLGYAHLALTPQEVFVDIASEQSPTPEIYGRLSGATCYAQDIQYPPGLSGNRIGGDACALPVPDQFATAATLTCSLEHFEGDADTRLFAEIARILKPGGKLIVAPLYMSPIDAVQTDPLYSAASDVRFDNAAVVYCAEGWRNRHGRFYSPDSLLRRVIAPHGGLAFTIFRLRNRADLPAGIYLRLFMTCVKR